MDAITELVAEANALQSDVEGLLALHDEGVVIVNVAGRRVVGKDAFRAAMAEALAGPLGAVTTEVAVDDVRLLRPDVALVSATKHITDRRPGGGDLPSMGRMTYVVVDDGDGWHIALAQTTPVRSA